MTPGIVAESDLSGNLQSEYVFFGGERVARKDFPGNAVAYYFSDHLKTASVVTDSVGNIKSESDYYPWGGELQFLNGDSNHYKFTGKERDAETGLDYFGARYYSNGLGRFITPDWAAKPVDIPYAVLGDPQSLNLYTYVRNIPTTNIDADGHVFQQFGVPNKDPGLQQAEKTAYDIAVQRLINNFYKNHPWAKKWDDSLERFSNFISFNGFETDEEVAADQAAWEAKDRAAWAKAYPRWPYPDRKIGIVSPEGLGFGSRAAQAEETLTRFGKEAESAEKLGAQAAAAEGKIGVHGVSTTARPNPRTVGSSAPRSVVEKTFKVHNTGKDPFHRTVELPKPVTQAIADLFNRVFGR
jgi:RHS repeat-associated protein